MRGARSVFAEIFPVDATAPVPEPQRRGRSAVFIDKRNECLVDRYYFVGQEKGLRYDLLIKEISETFFIAEITATEIIQTRLEQLRDLKTKAPSRAYFIRRWPQLSWG